MAASKKSSKGPQDDLTAINGIGMARQKWLRESMGVRTYSALAALDPARLESQLREEGKIIAPGDIATWIAEARELASIQTSPAAAADLLSGDWQPVASFVVEYQQQGADDTAIYRTRVHYMETGEGYTYSGVAYGPVCQWIEAHSGLSEQQPASQPEAAADEGLEVSPFSPRLRRLLDKVGLPNEPVVMATSSALAAPAPVIAAPAPEPATAGGFSPRLNHLLARMEQASRAEAAPPTSQAAAGTFSPRLQELIDRLMRT
jgi:hypothetical protein